jgi:plasmid stabilization system protein ParE
LKPVLLSNKALEELRAALDWYSQKGEAAIAAILFAEIQAARERIQRFPKLYPSYEEGTRRCTLQTFPYSLIYREMPEAIEVIVFCADRREPGYWKK